MIRLQNIRYTYPDQNTPVLDAFDLNVERGETILIEGANGCGKTTLLRVLAGIVPQFTGGRFSGQRSLDEKPHDAIDCSRLGMIFHGSDQQFIQSRVGQEILFMLENQNLPENEISARYQHLIDLFDLQSFVEREIHTLSSGERQVLKIALAWIMNPIAVLMDEPLSHLDSKNKDKILSILRKLQQERKLIYIIADHQSESWSHFPNIRRIQLSEEVGKIEILPLKAPVTNKTHIHLQEIGFSYKQKQIFKNFNRMIHAGERIVITGKNGSGKTTLLQLLSKQLKPHSGSIVYSDGLFIKFLPASSMEYLFSMPIEDEFRLEGRKIESSGPFELNAFKKQYAFDLSHGQQKKTALNLIFDTSADVILLDEPFSNLDVAAHGILIQAMESWSCSGKTIVFSSHEEHLFSQWASQIWRLE